MRPAPEALHGTRRPSRGRRSARRPPWTGCACTRTLRGCRGASPAARARTPQPRACAYWPRPRRARLPGAVRVRVLILPPLPQPPPLAGAGLAWPRARSCRARARASSTRHASQPTRPVSGPGGPLTRRTNRRRRCRCRRGRRRGPTRPGRPRTGTRSGAGSCSTRRTSRAPAMRAARCGCTRLRRDPAVTTCYAAHCTLAGYCSSIAHVVTRGTTAPFVVCLYL